jgi:hypothetical protein
VTIERNQCSFKSSFFFLFCKAVVLKTVAKTICKWLSSQRGTIQIFLSEKQIKSSVRMEHPFLDSAPIGSEQVHVVRRLWASGDQKQDSTWTFKSRSSLLAQNVSGTLSKIVLNCECKMDGLRLGFGMFLKKISRTSPYVKGKITVTHIIHPSRGRPLDLRILFENLATTSLGFFFEKPRNF